MSPTSAPSNSVISITGSNLADTSFVRFNTSNASFEVTVGGLNVSVPPGTGNVSVGVTDTLGNNVSVLNSFSYTNPSITGMSPTSAQSYSVISITGSNLANTSFVRFNTSNASFAVTVGGLNVSVPPGTGNVSVGVTDNLGNLVQAGSFQYSSGNTPTASVTLSTNRAVPNFPLVLTGTHVSFSSNTSVLFGTIPATRVVILSPTSMVVYVPSITTPHRIKIVSEDEILTEVFTPILPTVQSMSAQTGIVGDTVTLQGTLLTNMEYVLFGTYEAIITSKTNSSIVFKVPYGVGEVDVYVDKCMSTDASKCLAPR
jgi:hypothetical protein